MRRFFITIIFISLILLPTTAGAGPFDNAKGELGKIQAPTGLASDVGVTGKSVVRGVLAITGAIFFILMIYAGMLWLTAAGRDEPAAQAKKILEAAVIGMFVVMISYAATMLIPTKLGPGGGAADEADGGTPGPGAGGAQTTFGQAACRKLGGECESSMPGIQPDPKDPCDPDGMGDEDPFNGSVRGRCVDNNNTPCCELKESAGVGGQKGKLKCEYMGGICMNNCPQGMNNIGGCDTDIWFDAPDNCCAAPAP